MLTRDVILSPKMALMVKILIIFYGNGLFSKLPHSCNHFWAYICIENVIDIIRSLRNIKEEAPVNNVGGGYIAGTKPAGDDPPVNLKKKKRKPTPVGRYGTRRAWMQNLQGNGK